ncbi:hypothetical protein RAB80_011072 [Fusarium oxysporum f. sp. vasinfectum]|nr:hypothetical protein RAB80_011072 [Fusarium oxysporum f. sp. vasinfectum]KAK2929945.1 hypothetical protein FoTM2_010285 [Fusarium oxysporum f. sp. vasinfectum]
MAAAGLIDPTKTGNYPVILGDALLGKTSNEIFTGIKYNHKPTLSSDSAPNLARIKPSIPGKTASYDLTYTDNDAKYAFTGTRNKDSGQYVLYFDPSREAFILDLVDSTFNMNVTRLPGNADADSLRRQYPHIDSASNGASKTNIKAEKSASDKSNAKARAKSTTQKRDVKRKPEKKQAPKNIELSLPVPQSNEQSKPAEPKKHFEFKLPSPVNNRSQYETGPDPMDVDGEEEGEEGPEVDLAKELEDAFENLENSQQESPDGDESEISEED